MSAGPTFHGSPTGKDVDAQRGIHYAETLRVGTIAYPDPGKVQACHDEWATCTDTDAP